MAQIEDLFSYSDGFSLNKEITSKLVVAGQLTESPKVSILIPVYNHPDYLELALLSAINQDVSVPFEVIVVDNNHPDYQTRNQAVVENLHSPLVSYYVNMKNIGPCGNWNRCIELANGEFFTFCHDDDMLSPQAIKNLLNNIDTREPKKLIIGSNIVINSKGETIRKSKARSWECKKYNYSLKLFLINNPTNGCGSLYHRATVSELGGYKNSFWPCFDYALNVLYASKYGAVKIPELTFQYRVTEQSDSASCYSDINPTIKRIQKAIISRMYVKFFYSRVAKASSNISEMESLVIWEGKKRQNLLLDKIILGFYVRFFTILNRCK